MEKYTDILKMGASWLPLPTAMALFPESIIYFFLERRTEASNTTCGQEAVATYVTSRGCGQEAEVTNISSLGSEAVVPTLPCLGQKLWC